ncbi:molybdenum cofactor guanylyltransferase [Asaia sp. As-1742]|uniref:molybdenum cofactor guanylyltransferase n=1 Tax=Asaia sp. As-1742 TaxID=2608325 RepID=UPI00141F8B12|nr:molybdenum cofactor guanylyltransferase [Asaia sp. As-1742]NIE79541.1 molybdenum cofactor guanylyltransferase [Asaia sp. As-1742]
MTPAVILAGGQGSRLGYRDKALIPAGEGALLDQLLDRLRPQVGPVALSTRRDCETAYGRDLPLLQDRYTGAGPLSGVLAALEWAQGLGRSVVLTVPVDTAFVPNDLVKRLDVSPCCAMSRGRIHPLVALWPVSSLPLLDDYLSAGVTSGDHRQLAVWNFARRIDMTPIPFDDEGPDPFFNVNTPDDLLALTTLLEA